MSKSSITERMASGRRSLGFGTKKEKNKNCKQDALLPIIKVSGTKNNEDKEGEVDEVAEMEEIEEAYTLPEIPHAPLSGTTICIQGRFHVFWRLRVLLRYRGVLAAPVRCQRCAGVQSWMAFCFKRRTKSVLKAFQSEKDILALVSLGCGKSLVERLTAGRCIRP